MANSLYQQSLFLTAYLNLQKGLDDPYLARQYEAFISHDSFSAFLEEARPDLAAQGVDHLENVEFDGIDMAMVQDLFDLISQEEANLIGELATDNVQLTLPQLEAFWAVESNFRAAAPTDSFAEAQYHHFAADPNYLRFFEQYAEIKGLEGAELDAVRASVLQSHQEATTALDVSYDPMLYAGTQDLYGAVQRGQYDAIGDNLLSADATIFTPLETETAVAEADVEAEAPLTPDEQEWLDDVIAADVEIPAEPETEITAEPVNTDDLISQSFAAVGQDMELAEALINMQATDVADSAPVEVALNTDEVINQTFASIEADTALAQALAAQTPVEEVLSADADIAQTGFDTGFDIGQIFVPQAYGVEYTPEEATIAAEAEPVTVTPDIDPALLQADLDSSLQAPQLDLSDTDILFEASIDSSTQRFVVPGTSEVDQSTIGPTLTQEQRLAILAVDESVAASPDINNDNDNDINHEYVVVSGDNLWTIMREQYGVTGAGDITRAYRQIAELNGIDNPDLIHPDQKILMPQELALDNGNNYTYQGADVEAGNDAAISFENHDVANTYNTGLRISFGDAAPDGGPDNDNLHADNENRPLPVLRHDSLIAG